MVSFSFQVGMEDQLLELMEQDPSGTLHHALRQAGGAGGIHDIEGMLEGQLGKVDLLGLVAAEVMVMHAIRQIGQIAEVGFFPGIGHDHHLFDRRDLPDDAGNLGQAVKGLALEEIAVGGKEDPRPGLAEPVEDALDAEIGRAGGPGRPEADGSQHGDDRLGHVRHEADHPVPRPYPRLFQGPGRPGRRPVEFG